jgi:hypothetical protein
LTKCIVDFAVEIDEPAAWLNAIAPHIKCLVDVLKFAAPLVGPWLGMASPTEYETLFKNDISFMKELVAKLPEIQKSEASNWMKITGKQPDPGYAEGSAGQEGPQPAVGRPQKSANTGRSLSLAL